MYKRLIYISLFNWLIIALVVSFPAANFFTNNCNITRFGRKTEVIIPKTGENTLNDDSTEKPADKNSRKKHLIRFLGSRVIDMSAVQTHAPAALPGVVCAHIAHLFTKYVVRKAALPGYYNFLFRLSPF